MEQTFECDRFSLLERCIILDSRIGICLRDSKEEKMKKSIAIMIISALVLGLCACGSTSASGTSEASKPAETAAASETAQTSSSSEAEKQVAGGWAITENEAVALPEELATAFSEAAKDTNLTPIAYIASQVVSGTNYMLLCSSPDSKTGYQMIVIYKDLQGNTEITKTNDFNLTDYVNTDKDASNEILPGGWSTPEDLTVIPLPQDAQAALDKALEGFVGSKIEPMALLATQVVSGTNYAILARVSPVVQDPVAAVDVITVYADLNDNAEISSFCAINPADYNQ